MTYAELWYIQNPGILKTLAHSEPETFRILGYSELWDIQNRRYTQNLVNTTTFFVKELNSANEVLSNLKLYSNVSGLYPNLEKCEIAGIVVLKNVNVALCGIKSVNLMEYSMKIIGVYISYFKKILDNMNFQVVIKILPVFLKFGK